MKRLGLILLVMAVLTGFLLNEARAQSGSKLEGECYLVLTLEADYANWDVRLDGQPVGKLSVDGIFLKNFTCDKERVSVELRQGQNIMTKELAVLRAPSSHENPANRFIWRN